MTASRPETVVLGGGCYGRAIGQVLGAKPVPDDWLRDQKWGAKTIYAKPLLKCKHVFQVASETESAMRAAWRHDAFWCLYGKRGGELNTAPGLKWLLLDCRAPGVKPVELPSRFCFHVPAEACLREILSACRDAPVHSYDEWHDVHVADREVKCRRRMFRLVCEGEWTEGAVAEIRELTKEIRELGWERVCPQRPPDDHALANRIRAWLRSFPVTGAVTQWFQEGETLLRQTTLNS